MIPTNPPPSAPTVRATAREPSPPSRLSRWLREPLLHFFVLGALVFGIDQVVVGRSDDRHTIVVDASVDAEARQLFAASRGREPNPDELKALRERWIDNEVLYQEGLALQVDRGDSAIRERVIFKTLSVVDANVSLPPVDDTVLQQWFNSRLDTYEEPARFDFQEAVLTRNRSEAAARDFAAALNAGTPGDASAGLRVFKGRPHANLVHSYGEDFATALESTPVGQWTAMPTRNGWRVMRLQAMSPAKPADFETLRGVVLQDWTDQTMAEQRTAAVRALAQKYTIKLLDAPAATSIDPKPTAQAPARVAQQ